MNTQHKMAGFTIIELMITLVVAAILLAIAAPSFRSIIQDNRLTTDVNTLAASLNLTRSEAIKRGTQVTLCKSNDAASCVATANWQDGWIIWADTDNDAAVDANEIIRVIGGLSEGNTLAFATGNNAIVYNPTGFASNDDGTFRLCDDRGINFAKGLVISPSGGVRSAVAAELTSAGC